MKRVYWVIIILVLTASAGFYLFSAISSMQKTKLLMGEFKEVDHKLLQANDTSRPQHTNSPKQEYLISQFKSQLLFSIDSLKEYYQNSSEKKIADKNSSIIPNCLRLLGNIQQFNQLRWNMVDSSIPDTINFWPSSEKFSIQKWQSEFFQKNPKEVSIT